MVQQGIAIRLAKLRQNLVAPDNVLHAMIKPAWYGVHTMDHTYSIVFPLTVRYACMINVLISTAQARQRCTTNLSQVNGRNRH